MAAVIRLKRHSKEAPLEALLLACKRKKVEDITACDEENPFTTILKFAGTVENQEEDVHVHLSKIYKDVKKIHTHKPDVIGKLRRETRQSSQKNRFKVVNLSRSINEAPEPNANAEQSNLPGGIGVITKTLTVVDVVRDEFTVVDDKHETEDTTSGNDPSNDTKEMDENYVFDIYYTGDISDALLDNLLSVHSVTSGPLDFNKELNDGSDSDLSDDSNDENNWRNDYPDSDHSINEDDMRLAMQLEECQLGNDPRTLELFFNGIPSGWMVRVPSTGVLSSDEGEEGLLFTKEVDPLDVNRFGRGYASFKARVNKELYSSGEDDDDPDFVPPSSTSDDENKEDPSLRFM